MRSEGVVWHVHEGIVPLHLTGVVFLNWYNLGHSGERNIDPKKIAAEMEAKSVYFWFCVESVPLSKYGEFCCLLLTGCGTNRKICSAKNGLKTVVYKTS